MAFKTEIDQTKSATAALVACIVQTLNESDPTFQERFQAKVARWYDAMSERGESHSMETVSWVFDALSSKDPFQPRATS